MIGDALCLGIGGLGNVVLGGTGAGGDERFGVLNVPGMIVFGDLAFGGKKSHLILYDSSYMCLPCSFCNKRTISEHHFKVEQFIKVPNHFLTLLIHHYSEVHY